MGNREWTPVEIFKFVDTGEDLGTPDSFVDYAAYTELKAEAEKLAVALEQVKSGGGRAEILGLELSRCPTCVSAEIANAALTNWRRYLEGKK